MRVSIHLAVLGLLGAGAAGAAQASELTATVAGAASVAALSTTETPDVANIVARRPVHHPDGAGAAAAEHSADAPIVDHALTRLTGLSDDDAAAVRDFYAARGDAPIWVNADGVLTRTPKVVRELMAADDWGLDASAFDLPSLDVTAGDSEQLADIEARMTLATMTYARHAISGRVDPRDISGYWDQTPRTIVPDHVLSAVVESASPDGVMRGWHPQHPQFAALRKAYLALRADAEQAHPVTVPSGQTMRKGDRGDRVSKLRQRLDLDVTGDDADLFDDALHEAVEAFQEARGLEVDGLVGPGTLAALNRTTKDQIKRLLINMERWRWMPENIGDYHVWSNIPEYRVRVMRDGTEIFDERIVVGKLTNQTPIFSDEMERIEFHPYWHVPPSVKRDQILPGLRRSTNVLTRSGLRVKLNGRNVDPDQVDWSRVDVNRYHFYQPPGRSNVLGFVKFMFPNQHSVYMHDTTSRDLFSRSVRTFSYGCMRVQNPRKFAEVLLGADKGWSSARIGGIIASKTHTPVQLEEKIPVHITYFTARVNDDGRVLYFGDPYGHDRRTAAALDGKPLPSISIPVASADRGPSLADARQAAQGVRAWSNDVFTSDR